MSRELHTLRGTCDSNVTLLAPSEYISLAISLVGVPGLAVHNTRQIGKLACWTVKAISQTSTAIALLNQEQRELRNAILSNPAAIDYLFLKHHVGCEAVQQMCCFNLTDNYHSIETHLRNLHEMVQEVKESNGLGISIKGAWGKLWDAMWSWLPDFGARFRWLKNVLISIITIAILIVGICCCIQCLPGLCEMIKMCKIKRKIFVDSDPPPPYSFTMPVMSYPKQDLYNHKNTVWGAEMQPLEN